MSQPIHTNQLVLNPNTRQRLVSYEILEKKPDRNGFDIIIPNLKFPIPFPEYNFTEVPFRQDSLAFVEYLGLHIFDAQILYESAKAKVDNRNDVLTGVFLYLEIERYAREKGVQFQERQNDDTTFPFPELPLPDTSEGNDFMYSLGFTLGFLDNLNQLWRDTKKDPSYMMKYAVEIAFTTNLENLDILDYMFAILIRRRENLDGFEEAALEILAELDSMSETLS